MMYLQRSKPLGPPAILPNPPRHLSRIVNHCLAKEPDRRYQSALDVRNELDELQREVASGEVELASTPSGIGPIPDKVPTYLGRRIRPIHGVIVLAVIAAVAVIWFFGRGSSVPPGSWR